MRYVAGLVLAVGIACGVLAETLEDEIVRLFNEGNYAEAEPLVMRRVNESIELNGPDHPATSTRLKVLALLYKKQAKYDKAEPLYKQALAIDEKVLGTDHPSTAASLSNLALCCVSQRKYDEAEPLYKRALAICEKALGPDHPDTAVVRWSYEAMQEERDAK